MPPRKSPQQDRLVLVLAEESDFVYTSPTASVYSGLAEKLSKKRPAATALVKAAEAAGLVVRVPPNKLQLTWQGLLWANRLLCDLGDSSHPKVPEVELVGAPSNWQELAGSDLIANPRGDRSRDFNKRGGWETRSISGTAGSGSPTARNPSGPAPNPARRHSDSRRSRPASEVQREASQADLLIKHLRSKGFILVSGGGIEAKVGKIIDNSNRDQIVALLRHMASDGKIARRARGGFTVGIAIPGHEDAMDKKLTAPSGKVAPKRGPRAVPDADELAFTEDSPDVDEEEDFELAS
ncbi:hypothetical protein EPO04_01565 [Patescibacteria group bacterium]|nr:MAG: hypothetical protein EPO04_01565 [Patescibacteria group bacterium]